MHINIGPTYGVVFVCIIIDILGYSNCQFHHILRLKAGFPPHPLLNFQSQKFIHFL